MYLPRSLISHLYSQLLATQHPLSPPVLILAALEPDALCACRILAALLKRDYIPHKIKPIAGYGDLLVAGEDMVRPMRLSEGGTGGVVVCLGVGGLIPLAEYFGLEPDENNEAGADGVNVWVFDSRRPYNLNNVFGSSIAAPAPDHGGQVTVSEPGVSRGKISQGYRSNKGGIIVFDDGDIEGELDVEREAFFELESMRAQLDQMPENADEDIYGSDSDDGQPVRTPQTSPGQKRKSWDRDENEGEDDESDKENSRPHQRRKSNSKSTPIASEPQTPSRLPRQRQPSPLTSTPPSNQLSSQPRAQATPEPPQPTLRQQRRRFFRRKRKYDGTIFDYHTLGTSYSEPISSLMYSLVSELGREDNDLLWLTIIGVSAAETYGRTSSGLAIVQHDRPQAITGWHGSREGRIKQLLRDEVRRLNPPELTETGREVLRGHAGDVIPTHARSPTDNSIVLSPEPRFLLVRHWSLYDSMMHSPYLSAKLHIWSEPGKRRLHKLLAKMGISLSQCRQSYTHMDMDLKRVLRERLLHVAPQYGLDGLVPPATNERGDREGWGFVRSWGWKACLSAADVATVLGAMLEVGQSHLANLPQSRSSTSATDTSQVAAEEALTRFYTAYDALLAPQRLLTAVPLTQSLHRAILRTGTSIMQKRQIKHLRAFRMALLKEGPDLPLFTAPGALIKLALWIGEAVAELEPERRERKALTPLVLGCLDEARDLYVVVGLGGGAPRARSTGAAANRKKAREARREARSKERAERREARETARAERAQARAARAEGEDDDEDDETEDEPDSDSSSESEDDEDDVPEGARRRTNRNRFGVAFGEVAEATRARVRQDSFEHAVMEVKREDLSGFLERLSSRTVVG